MLYTVSQASQMLGVSKVTIYNKLNSLNSELKPYIKRKNNILHIDDKGLLIIKESIDLINVQNTLNNEDIKVSSKEESNDSLNQFKDVKELIETVKNMVENSQGNYVNSLVSQIELLKSELQKKDEQINNTLRLLENSQVLLKQHKEKVLMLELQEKNKRKGFFKNFIKYKSD